MNGEKFEGLSNLSEEELNNAINAPIAEAGAEHENPDKLEGLTDEDVGAGLSDLEMDRQQDANEREDEETS
ncbi:MAG: hypothetical protein A2725_03170 [Candidatus Magasanikbacteria bacterium RIFCSPHIGHO2_01_FULL_33_34]|uniref:Uncharacterized protein n=1 Tax=Candidatus Magasanikbacteria bacterium RIFCSPHIGHO2_01_FULL_33_34 TaxID=1798671 RepID=A0A1F6LHC2_9BACT|nr:MAG: hypothetical protein A2725_03170 [Candidatus Magasanikbacteria bacterium RIFCSPHIGHO2_01_FULL_33_34]OGH66132.1 MAG: hypothetical protein A3B83_00660 [Candidatus Magasanikbacteria bacterium RIFCSPHIGHO2_02_FULL_33_17]OGH75978.1 MAG: hypothetical protein A3A89_00570 [Candidatus Magasanikbacteria bacterium RIFCSPLOWO2_01_FULL_33_34]